MVLLVLLDQLVLLDPLDHVEKEAVMDPLVHLGYVA